MSRCKTTTLLAFAIFTTTIGVAIALKASALDRSASPLTVAMTLKDDATNGVTVSKDGRIFFVSTMSKKDRHLNVGEFVNGSEVPYPNQQWNDWKIGGDAKAAFVHANALRIGPESDLWIVDAGAPDMGESAVSGGAKLVRVSLASNEVVKVYDLAMVVKPNSFVDDIRFDKETAYLTDAGEGALIVLDLKSGKARRVLENDGSTVAQRDLTANQKPLSNKNKNPVRVAADQLEISPDAKWLYFQTAEGPLYRIALTALQNEKLSPQQLHAESEKWITTPSTGGTAMDAAGNIYVADPDKNRILKIAPDKTTTTLVQDSRLQWPDAMWITDQGDLWIPVPQLNRTPGMNGGVDAIQYPTVVFKMKIDQKPLRR